MMTRARSDPHDGLPDEIRRQFGTPAMTRFLRAIPAIGETPDMDDRFAELLSQLDHAERPARSAGSRQR